jgi:hypothetical protein
MPKQSLFGTLILKNDLYSLLGISSGTIKVVIEIGAKFSDQIHSRVYDPQHRPPGAGPVEDVHIQVP